MVRGAVPLTAKENQSFRFSLAWLPFTSNGSFVHTHTRASQGEEKYPNFQNVLSWEYTSFDFTCYIALLGQTFLKLFRSFIFSFSLIFPTISHNYKTVEYIRRNKGKKMKSTYLYSKHYTFWLKEKIHLIIIIVVLDIKVLVKVVILLWQRIHIDFCTVWCSAIIILVCVCANTSFSWHASDTQYYYYYYNVFFSLCCFTLLLRVDIFLFVLRLTGASSLWFSSW